MHPDEAGEVKAKYSRLYTAVDHFTLEHRGAASTALPSVYVGLDAPGFHRCLEWLRDGYGAKFLMASATMRGIVGEGIRWRWTCQKS